MAQYETGGQRVGRRMILRVDRGDIIHVDLEPTKGKEIKGYRPALVLTPKAFNALGLALLAPITQGGGAARENGFTVQLMGSGSETQGVVNVQQMTMIDLSGERRVRVVEKLDGAFVDEVLARARTLLE
jgi:mRNA interferase ChpB